MKEAQSIHDRTNKLLEASQSIAHVGGWELDLITKDLFWTKETYRIHDTTPEEFNPTLDAGVGCYLPKSREILLEALRAASEDGEGYDLELELETTKGRNIHVRTTCEVTIAEGKPVKLTGAFQDITDQKTAQNQLSIALEKTKQNENYLNNIINSIGDGLIVQDDQSRFLLANDAICDLLGVARKDLLGKTLAEHVLPKEHEHFVRKDKQIIATGQEIISEEPLTLRNEETRIISTRKKRYIDHKGNKFLIGVSRDVTSIKLEEEKSKRTNQLLEASQSIAHVGGWELDIVTNELFWTPEIYRIFEMAPEDFNPTLESGMSFFPPESAEILSKAIQSAMESGKGYDLELEAKTIKSRLIHVRSTCEIILKDGKPIKLTGTFQDITDQKKREAEIVKLSKVVEQSPESIIITDIDGNIEYTNPQFTKATGYSQEEVLGEKPRILRSGKHTEAFYDDLWATITAGRSWKGEFQNKKKNGDLYWESASIIPLKNSIGEVTKYVAIKEDITEKRKIFFELKEAKEKVERNEQYLNNIINSIGDPFFVKDDQSRILLANDTFCKMFGMSREDIIGKTLAEHIPVEEQEHFLKIDQQVITTGVESIVEETITIEKGKTQTISTRKTRFVDSKGDKFLIGTIRDLTDRKELENKLLKNAQILETSQSTAKVGGWELDLVTKKLIWTAETYRIHDTTPEEFEPTTAESGLAFYLPESYNALTEAFKSALESGHGFELELELNTAKNRKINVRTTGRVIFEEAKPIRMVGAIQDITELKIHEQKLKDSEASVSATLNALSSSICVIDKTGKILQVNKTWDEFAEAGGHNRPPGCFSDYNYFDVCKADFENEDARVVYYGLQVLLKGDIDSFEHEYPCHAPDKNQWFLLRAKLMETDERNIVISHINITKRKLLEIEQQKLIEQANLAMKAGELGLWTLDITSGKLEWNDEQLEIYGLSRNEFEEGIDDWQKQLHPEDAEFANEKLAGIFRGEAFHNVEFRIIRRSGEIRHIQASGTPIYNQDNKPSQFIGINRDITERKQIEQELRKSDRVFNLAVDMFCIAGFDGYFKYLNPAWERTLGWTTEELLTKPWIEFIHPDDKNNTEDIKTVIVDGQEVLEFENRYICKDGSVKWLSWKSQPFPDEHIMVGAARDVTMQKEQKRELEQSERHLKNAQRIAKMGSWFHDIKTNVVTWTEELYKMFGLDADMPAPKWNEQPKNYSKESWELLSSTVEKTSKDGVPYELELNIIQKDKHMGWILARGEALKDDNGEIYALSGVALDITNKKQQEQSLRQSKASLQRAQQIAKLGNWYLDVKTNRVDWSDQLFTMFGLDPVMAAPQWDKQHKYYTNESWELLSSAVEKASKDGVPYELELNIIRNDKTLGWITSRGEALKNDNGEIYALTGIAQDITLRKHSERELRKLSTAVEQSPVSIVITDTNGVIEYANPKFSKISGYSFEEVIGQNPKVLQSGYHDESFYKNMWKTLISGKTWTGEFLNKNKNGGLYWESASISPLKNSKEETTNFVAVKEDITVKKTLMKELEVAKERAEAANELKDVFLANTSHEIRTPLNAIIGFSRLLSDDLGEKDKEVYLDQIKSNSEQLLSLVNDLLNLTKLEGGNVALMNKPVDLNKLVRSIFAQHHQYIETHHKEIELKLTVPKSEQNLIQVDEIKLKEILHNLIDNAVKFTKNGTIELGYTLTSKEIEFFVKDDGIGIPPNQQDAIFNRFTQVPGTSDKYGGTGLGLSICRGLVEVMGGKLWVESEINVGSTFLFTLPRVSADFIKATPTENTNISRSDKPVNKVLVADDSASVRLFYKTILKKLKVDTLLAKSGEEAIDLYQQNIESIDLVLMDIRMPGMDGIEAMKRIKEINPDIKVVAQTAFAMDTELERFRKEGFDDCLTKPIPEDELMKLLKG